MATCLLQLSLTSTGERLPVLLISPPDIPNAPTSQLLTDHTSLNSLCQQTHVHLSPDCPVITRHFFHPYDPAPHQAHSQALIHENVVYPATMLLIERVYPCQAVQSSHLWVQEPKGVRKPLRDASCENSTHPTCLWSARGPVQLMVDNIIKVSTDQKRHPLAIRLLQPSSQDLGNSSITPRCRWCIYHHHPQPKAPWKRKVHSDQTTFPTLDGLRILSPSLPHQHHHSIIP